MELVQQAEIPTVFEQLKELGTNTPELYALEREFIFGKYTFEFYDRLQVYINSLTSINIEVKQPNYDIFISSSHLNQTEVEDIAYTLRAQNLSVFFFDESAEMFSENHFTDKIHEVLKNSTHFLLYCTPEAMQSKWVEKEYESFFREEYSTAPQQRKMFILKGKNFHPGLIPALLKNIEPSENINKVLLALGKKILRKAYNSEKKNIQNLPRLFIQMDSLPKEKEISYVKINSVCTLLMSK